MTGKVVLSGEDLELVLAVCACVVEVTQDRRVAQLGLKLMANAEQDAKEATELVNRGYL